MKRQGIRLSILVLLLLAVWSAAVTGAEAEAKNGWEKDSYYKDGVKQTGLVKIDTKTYLFSSKGVLKKNVPVYVDKKNGKKTYYNVSSEGVAQKLSGTKLLAAKRLVKLNAYSRKSSKNLKKAFRWSASLPYWNNTVSKKGSKAAKYYGDYGFKQQRGDCNTVAYTFYWMARLLGYEAKAVQGYVPDGSMDNLKTHAWVMIKMNGTSYYFDPDLNRTLYKGTNKGFKFTFGTSGTYMYHNSKKKPMEKIK